MLGLERVQPESGADLPHELQQKSDQQPNPSPERFVPFLAALKEEGAYTLKRGGPAAVDTLPSIRAPRQQEYPDKAKYEADNLGEMKHDHEGRDSHGIVVTRSKAGVNDIRGFSLGVRVRFGGLLLIAKQIFPEKPISRKGLSAPVPVLCRYKRKA